MNGMLPASNPQQLHPARLPPRQVRYERGLNSSNEERRGRWVCGPRLPQDQDVAVEADFIAASARRFISSAGTSSTCVATVQM